MADIEETDSANALIPNDPTVERLREAAAECTACPLYRNATQTVFGEGPESAAVMFVGEQPGDTEDLAGHPFVGGAGKLLDRCLEAARIDRSRCYVTNGQAFQMDPARHQAHPQQARLDGDRGV